VVGLGYPGWEALHFPLGTTLPIVDLAYHGPGNFVGVVTGTGFALDAGGELDPSQPLIPSYWTLASAGLSSLTYASAAYPFAGVKELTAVRLLPGETVRVRTGAEQQHIQAGTPRVLDLVAVGAHFPDGSHRVYVLDVSNVLAPVPFGPSQGILLPDRIGIIQRIEVDPVGGDLRVVAANAEVRIDPDRLTMAPGGPGPGVLHPAVLRITEGLGSTHHGTGGSTFGVSVLSDLNRVHFTGPEMSMVSFPSEAAVVRPDALRAEPDRALREERIRRALRGLSTETDLRPARARAEAGIPRTADLPGVHTHVLIRAPGRRRARARPVRRRPRSPRSLRPRPRRGP
jgi:hypothetical protein